MESLLDEEKKGGYSPDLSTLRYSNYGGFPELHDVEVRRMNKIKWLALLFGSTAAIALVIQGSISLLAWIARGFYTKSN